MKSILVFMAVFSSIASAAPRRNGHAVLILKQLRNDDAKPQKYSYSFEAENEIAVSDSGISEGVYSYIYNGVIYTLQWIANDKGFQTRRGRLPTSPPLPDHVVKILAGLRREGRF